MSKINQEQSKKNLKTLFIGFSFSLRADGSPGIYNEAIAQKIQTDIKERTEGERPIVGLQWKIYDVLYNSPLQESRDYFDSLDDVIVVEPPKFRGNDIRNPHLLCDILKSHKYPAIKELYNKLKQQDIERICGDLEKIEYADRDRSRLDQIRVDIAELLNENIDEQRFFQDFKQYIELHDLNRPEKGMLGLEKREMPKGNEPLRKYQARRVNRLIIEAIFPDWVLKRGEYLNASQVAEHILKKNLENINDIKIFAHPKHAAWCKYLVGKFVPGLSDKIYINKYETFPGWDAESAQVWCKSEENYEAYINTPL